MVTTSFLNTNDKRSLWRGQLFVVVCIMGFSWLGIATRSSELFGLFLGDECGHAGLAAAQPQLGA